jgi:hypothetical protein
MKTHVDNVYTWITIYHNRITYSIRVRKFWVVIWRVMVAKTATKMIMLKLNPTRSYHTKINTIACIKYILFHPMYSYNQTIHYHNIIQHKYLIIYKFQRKTTHNYTPVFTALNTDNYIVYNIYIHTYIHTKSKECLLCVVDIMRATSLFIVVGILLKPLYTYVYDFGRLKS